MKSNFKKIVQVIIAVLGITVINSNIVYAATNEPSIKIDGDFQDWTSMPIQYDDNENDSSSIPTRENLQSIQYFSDKDYLYLKVERDKSVENSGASPANNLWQIDTIIFNGSKFTSKHWVPWLNTNGSWKQLSGSTFRTEVIKDSNLNKYTVRVSIKGGAVIEETISASSDGSIIEYRLPLEIIGLTAENPTVEFGVKSGIGQYEPNQDWIPSTGPITSTQGPIFGVLTPFLVIATFVIISRYSK